jgi:hypothetical protein
LRAAVDKARGVNMPNDTIDRAIKKGTGDLDGITYEEFNYEVFGPGGTAVLVEIMTDNRNRTASEIRSVITHHGGQPGRVGIGRLDVQEAGAGRLREGRGRRGEADRPGDRAGRGGHPTEGESLVVVTEPKEFERIATASRRPGCRIRRTPR